MMLPLGDADWFRIAVFVVVIAGYVIRTLAGGLRKTGLPPVAPMARPEAPDNPATPGTRTRQQINDELSEFLRRAAEKRTGTPPPSLQPQAAQTAPRPRKRRQTKPVAAPRKPEEPLAQRRVLKSSLDTREFEQRAEKLTSLDKGDEIGSHLRQVFDHQLGQFASEAAPQPVVTPAEAPLADQLTISTAAELLGLLHSPQSLRQAILLNEILSRPTDRW
jgi:hypothetical protein